MTPPPVLCPASGVRVTIAQQWHAYENKPGHGSVRCPACGQRTGLRLADYTLYHHRDRDTAATAAGSATKEGGSRP